MDVADVVPADVAAELPYRLQERHDLDVTDGPADLHDDDVDVFFGEPRHAFFDLVGDVRDHLHRLAEVVAPSLLGDDGRIDEAGRGVRVAVQVLVDEPLVVAEIEVRLSAVLGHEDLTVLERVHRARVHVYVRVELDHRDPQAPAFEQSAERRRGQALAERGGDTTGDENVLTHASTSWCTTQR